MQNISALIVEDNPADAKLIAIYLQGIEAFNTEVTHSGTLNNAAEEIQNKHFDLILLDLGLPDGHGINTVNKILSITSDPAIVIMTGVYDPELASEAIYVGAQDFIVKSDANSKILERTIANAFQRNKIKQELKKTQGTFRAVIQTANDAIITTNEQLKIISWNPAAEKIFGYNAEEIIEQSIFILFDDSEHAALLKKLAHIHDPNIKDETHLVEFSARNCFSILFPVELSIASWHSDKIRFCSLVIRDITERRRVDKMKSEFISVISHELRTPLTALIGSLKLVLGGVTGTISSKTGDFLNIAQSNGERLLLLINDILDMSKLEEGQMELHFENVSIKQVINDAIIENQAYANRYDVKFVITETTEDYVLYVDQMRLLQILANFMSNAAKYSTKHENIQISISRNDHKIRIAVSNKGEGVPEEFHNKVFEKFSQSDSSTTRKVGGTGLGLHISKILTEKMNGKIGFTSEKNVKTTFYVDFPENIDH